MGKSEVGIRIQASGIGPHINPSIEPTSTEAKVSQDTPAL